MRIPPIAVRGASHGSGALANDRRRSPRANVQSEGLLNHKNRWTAITIVDLSRHGVRLCGSGSFKAGDQVIVDLPTPCRRVQLEGRVIWNDHRRKRMAGITFGAMSRTEAVALNAAVLEATRRTTRYETDAVVLTDDPDAQLALADGIWEQACNVVARTSTAGVLDHLAGERGARVIAVLVSASLDERVGQELLDRIAREYPAVRRVLLVDNLTDPSALGQTLPHFMLLSPYRTEELGMAIHGRHIDRDEL